MCHDSLLKSVLYKLHTYLLTYLLTCGNLGYKNTKEICNCHVY